MVTLSHYPINWLILTFERYLLFMWIQMSESKEVSIVDLIKTTPRSNKFPGINQANHCWNRYNEWVMCMKTTEGDENACLQMRQLMASICPVEWVEKWDDERSEGTFPGVKGA